MAGASRLSRRQFLAGALGVGAAGALAATLGRGAVESLVSGAPGSSAPADARLVLCTLYGGNDGLNTVIPYQDGHYLGGRGALAYQPHEVIPLDDGLALHPSLVGFKKLWDAGRLAIVRGVGYPNPSFSHFRSMDIWQSAVPDTDVGTGWLGRWLDATGGDPLRAISFGPTLPMALSGARSQGAAIPSGPLHLAGSAELRAAFAALSRVAPGEEAMPAQVAQSGADLIRVQHTLAEILGAAGGGAAGAGDGAGRGGAGSALGGQLDVVSRLITAGAPSRVYGVSLGGFDTHADEKATQARLLGQVDEAVSKFVNGLEGNRRGRGTVVAIYSEFGRRVAANASGGTDHGSAAPVFVVGPGVKGGFFGDEPSLGALDDGNLRFTTDFRSVYATLLEQVVGVDPKVALGRSFPTLGFV